MRRRRRSENGREEGERRGEGAEGVRRRVPHKYLKIYNFPKSPSSLGGIPRFRFLIHMAVIKNPKSALEMAVRPS